jgi:hypothetical protein
VLSFSERAQEHWAPEIPVCVICASRTAILKSYSPFLKMGNVSPYFPFLPILSHYTKIDPCSLLSFKTVVRHRKNFFMCGYQVPVILQGN